jgi:SPOR domain
MSRSSPIGQSGLRSPPWRQASDDQPTQPTTQPSPHWPPPQQQGYYLPQSGADDTAQQGYAPQPRMPQAPAHQAQSRPLPFNRFPPPANEVDAGRGFASAGPQPSAHQLPPFNRFPQPAPEPEPNYGFPQASQQQPPFGYPPAAQPQQSASAHWGQQQADPSGFDLGSYMPAPGQQGFGQPEAGPFQGQHEPPAFAAAQGYGEMDAEFDEAMAEEEEAPRRGPRGLMIVAALVGAIGLGGGMAYGYKTLFPSRTGPVAMIKDTQGPVKSKPEVADGKGFPHTDKKLLNRLGDDTGSTSTAGAAASEPQEGDDPNGPRRVRTIPITPGGPQPMPPVVVASAPPPAAAPAPLVGVPGVMLEPMGPGPGQVRMMPPPGTPPSAQRVQLPPQAQMPPARAQPPVRVASAANTPPAAAAEPAPPVRKVPAAPKPAADGTEKAPVPKKVASAPVATASSGAGYVAVLSSQKTRMDALKIFANMQEKYGDVLSSKTPDVQEANLGEKGVRYRLVVGPPGSKEAAASVCAQLKTAGFVGCWVTSY